MRTAGVLTLVLLSPNLVAEDGKQPLTFDQDVLPIFRSRCIRCHAGVEPKAGLNLTSPSSLLTGGISGAALRIRAAESSLLYEKISSGQMPPVGQKLTAQEKGIIRRWINDGAQGVSNAASVDQSDAVTHVEHWSFRPPDRFAIPAVSENHRIRNPVDAFTLRQLQLSRLTPAPEADRLTLLRRVFFDLIGLPPSPDEVEQFMSDESPDAYERLIDRLLCSVHYGERWARHWLDIAGFAETAGILNEDRELPLAWKYRDYVVRAFNSDKPYDRFLQEQIAGDELTDYWTAFESMDRLNDEVIEGITATGFLRTAADPSRPDFSEIKNAASQYFYPTLFDTLQIVCSSTMGLTIQCARCHSHKFDPIPQLDYYRMQAVFMSAYRPDNWVPQMERRLPVASKKEKQAAETRNAEVDQNVSKLHSDLQELKKTFAERLFEDRLAELPTDVRDEVRAALAVTADKRTDIQGDLAAEYEERLRPQGSELDTALVKYDEYKQQLDRLNSLIDAEERGRWRFDEVRALYDVPGESKTPVLLRGDALTPGPLVEPGVIASLETPQAFEWTAPNPDAKTSGRRLAFARWLTQPRHPLTARVIVNRIWMHHFGTGLVATPDDFGVSGSPPSHPELLDWLATEFVRSGWSIRNLHRLILTSATWRQHSRVSAEHRKAGERTDPENRLYWQQTLKRLDAETLRDSVLAVSGMLNTELYGVSQEIPREQYGKLIVPAGQDRNRRSIYVQNRRLYPDSMLQVFDQPTMSVNCVQRSTSTVSTQALTLLNGETLSRAAAAFADRVLAEFPEDPVGGACLIAYSRQPGSDEQIFLSQFLNELTLQYRSEQDQTKSHLADTARRQALGDLCHMLMSCSEFIYVD
ncbi:MAG: PSD1 and planctomycete cytochrome C domain-containing protein [Fuerstiella sp.]|nr:PSD1 and planctomycete cytochrome C domain-containing protein [Fuerstiella sp.]